MDSSHPGAHFLDFADVTLDPEEKPEDLYQRLLAFIEDNLVCMDSNITHHGDKPDDDEELSPTLENIVVLVWLQLLNKDLPRLVKQRYGTDLRCRTLASIKPEISQALPSLLDELRTNSSDCSVMQTRTAPQRVKYKFSNRTRPVKNCPLCKQAGRGDQHFLSECRFLPPPSPPPRTVSL